MINLESLAEKRAEASQHSVHDWLSAFYNPQAQELFVTFTDGEIMKTIMNSSRPEVLDCMVGLMLSLRQVDQIEMPFDLLSQKVAASPHSLGEWFDAIFELTVWLEDQKKTPSCQDMLSFVEQCSTQTKTLTGVSPLAEEVRRVLTNEGFKA